MKINLDRKVVYTSVENDTRTYCYSLNDQKEIEIDTYSDGSISFIWLFDNKRRFGECIVASGYSDSLKMKPNITEVINADTEVLDTDLLIRVADQLIEM